MSDRQTGTVKWFNVEKRYGFIIPDDASADVFVHHTGIDREGFRQLNEGQDVEFSVTDSERGLLAQKVATLA